MIKFCRVTLKILASRTTIEILSVGIPRKLKNHEILISLIE